MSSKRINQDEDVDVENKGRNKLIRPNSRYLGDDQELDPNALIKIMSKSNERNQKRVEEAAKDEKVELFDDELIPKKIRINAKIDEERLSGPNGFPRLQQDLLNFKPKGKGHEIQDLRKLMTTYQLWAHQMFPRTNLKDTLVAVEKLCHKRTMQPAMRAYRDLAKYGKEGRPALPLSDDEDASAQHQSGSPSTRSNATVVAKALKANELFDGVDFDQVFSDDDDLFKNDNLLLHASTSKLTTDGLRPSTNPAKDVNHDEVGSLNEESHQQDRDKVDSNNREHHDEEEALLDLIEESEKHERLNDHRISTLTQETENGRARDLSIASAEEADVVDEVAMLGQMQEEVLAVKVSNKKDDGEDTIDMRLENDEVTEELSLIDIEYKMMELAEDMARDVAADLRSDGIRDIEVEDLITDMMRDPEGELRDEAIAALRSEMM